MSCLLPPKSSTRAALPSGVSGGAFSDSSTATLLSLVVSSAGGGAAPWAKAGTVKPDARSSVRQRAESVRSNRLFLIAIFLLFVVVIHHTAGNCAARQHSAQLSRGHTQGAHHLDDLQILCLGFLCLQRLELFLILCDLLADLSNLLVNALNFVLCHRLSLLLKNLCYQFIRP
ncbi:hypothetical protein C678_0119 [Clostridioides difficile F665]|nr:hypothetical protein C678_0119 [Clostridioides difficile F665]